jgi:LysM repeat protein
MLVTQEDTFSSIDLELEDKIYENEATHIFHTITPEDTLVSIAIKYGVTEEEIKKLNSFIDFDAFARKNLIIPKRDFTSLPKRSPSIPVHLNSTKTFSPIALTRSSVSYHNIQSLSRPRVKPIRQVPSPVNREADVKKQIHEGKEYFIHYLKRSDSLTSLAVRYGVTSDEIIDYNDCTDLDTYQGDYIMIPKPE